MGSREFSGQIDWKDCGDSLGGEPEGLSLDAVEAVCREVQRPLETKVLP